jgi:hypothetical protein
MTSPLWSSVGRAAVIHIYILPLERSWQLLAILPCGKPQRALFNAMRACKWKGSLGVICLLEAHFLFLIDKRSFQSTKYILIPAGGKSLVAR